jgi:pyrimidine-nucleoside phosphorylase
LTGGTLDKLESIDGFQTQISPEESYKILHDVGAFIVGASERIAPADRKLYALRDVTGTVESIPLITASILSKKLAANLDALVMDVKSGSGAFMKTQQQATELAETLVRVGRQAGLPTTALLTDMDQPLGQAIGNAIEVNESVEVLQGLGGEVRDLSIELCADLLVQVRVAATLDDARVRLAQAIDSGRAMERFERMVHAQGGRLNCPLKLAAATEIVAQTSGFLEHYDCEAIGEAIVALGGGRRKKGDSIDHRVGIKIHGRIGDPINEGQPVLTLHTHKGQATDYVRGLGKAVEINENQVPRRPLILKRITSHEQGQQSQQQ